jgi:hypothetical protein
MTAFLAIAWRVLSWCVPIPLALIVAAAGWVAIDKHSAVRKAVDKAVTELVAGAEIAALEAQLNAANVATALQKARADTLQEANQQLEEDREQDEAEDAKRVAELEAIKARPLPPTCNEDDFVVKEEDLIR